MLLHPDLVSSRCVRIIITVAGWLGISRESGGEAGAGDGCDLKFSVALCLFNECPIKGCLPAAGDSSFVSETEHLPDFCS